MSNKKMYSYLIIKLTISSPTSTKRPYKLKIKVCLSKIKMNQKKKLIRNLKLSHPYNKIDTRINFKNKVQTVVLI